MKVTRVGVLNDRSDTERRVALVPETVRRLAKNGITAIVETGAGAAACYGDSTYVDAGATVGSREDVLAGADVVMTVSSPRTEDLDRFRPGQVLVGVMSPMTRPGLMADLAARDVMAVSLDCVPRTISRAQSLDVLTSQAGIAGYKAVLVGAAAFGRWFPMMITAAGTSRPAAVLVLGAGVAGLSAIGTARRLGAAVTAYDVRPETRSEIESLGAKFLKLASAIDAGGDGGYARALTPAEQQAQSEELEKKLASFDVVITTALVPGRRPPVLVTGAALARMRAGTVVVDVASGPHGGNVEGSEPGETTSTDNGVIVIGASDLPSSMATASSDSLSQNMAAALSALVHDGELVFDPTDEVQAAIVITEGGRVANPAVAQLLDGQEEDQSDERIAAV